ncbi:MAG: hypothetical protein AABX53_03410 [Nanoarchaeota archaeon]
MEKRPEYKGTFQDLCVDQVRRGNSYASGFLKDGKSALALALERAKRIGLPTEVIHRAEERGMLESEAGKSVLANSSYSLLMRQKPAVINSVKKTFFLSDSEVNHLLTAAVGDGLLLMDDEHSEIKILASDEEHTIITTNADEVLATRKVETESERLDRVQKEINKQIDNRNKREKVRVIKGDDCISSKNLSESALEYLRKNKYKEISFKGIISGNKQKYFIKPKKSESPQHIFCVYDIASYLKSFTEKVFTYHAVKADIVFEVNGKEYAIEVETGKMMKHKKEELKKKVENLNNKYQDRWFFVVTDRNLRTKYAKLGTTYDKRHLTSVINRIVSDSAN